MKPRCLRGEWDGRAASSPVWQFIHDFAFLSEAKLELQLQSSVSETAQKEGENKSPLNATPRELLSH